MKRFMSIALAVVMAFALQATAFAAAPANMDGPGGIILPRAAIYPHDLLYRDSVQWELYSGLV